MKQKLLQISIITLFFNLICFVSNAQIKGSLNGEILDNISQAISFANVALLHDSDTSLVKGTVADFEGKFILTAISPGNYKIRITAIGFEKYLSETIAITNNTVDLGVITVNQSVQQLEAIEVKGQKQVIERKLDRTIFNVENTMLTSGTDGVEVLTKMPGVMLDTDGNIMINGKSGVKIMINGKESHLTGKDLTNMLKTMSADNISKVEIITNPSAKYSAEGTSGILNIQMKRSKEIGYNGSVYTGVKQGRYLSYQGGASLYYRSGKLNAFGQIDYRANERFNSINLNRTFGEADELVKFEQHSYIKRKENQPSFRTGLDYFINDKNILGVMINGFVEHENENIPTATNITDIKNDIRKINQASADNNADVYKISANVNYMYNIDTLGRQFTVDLDHSYFDKEMKSMYHSQENLVGTNGSPITTARSSQPVTVKISSLKADYVHPIGDFRIETGAKYSNSVADNLAAFDSLKEDGWKVDEFRTNSFLYEEDVLAAYINFSGKKGKLAFQGGLRAEQTYTKGASSSNEKSIDRNYIEFFPSVFLQHNINKNNVINYSYSRRLNRPNFRNLNPFIVYLDPYTGAQGNPYLKPQFSNNYQIEYLLMSKYSISFTYLHTYDVLQQLIRQNKETKVSIQTNDNLDSMDDFTINLNIPVSVTKWWESTNNLTWYTAKYKTYTDETSINQRTNTLFFRTMNTFLLPYNIKAELSGFYTTPFIDGSLGIGELFSAEVGVEKAFFDDKLSVSLKFKDIFRTEEVKFDSKQDNVNLSGYQYQDKQKVKLTLRYRFKKGDKVNMRRRTQGNQEEQRRAN